MARNKSAKNRERKNKINLVFDETKRREFLGGFHKRKLERKKKAQDDLKQKLKEEKRRIKQENKESYKKLVLSSRPIPELEKLLQDEYSDKEEEVSVKIVELPTDALADSHRFIGDNRPLRSDTAAKKPKVQVKEEAELPGMGFEVQEESEIENDSEDEKTVSSKKDLKRLLKHQATKKIQKSKAFQLKNKMERLKNKKKSRQTKNANEKVKAVAGGKNTKKIKKKKVIGRRKK